MHAQVYLNDKIVDAAKAAVAPVSAAMLYGRGVFTTLAVHGGRPFLWPQHWLRLLDHAGRVRLDVSDYEEEGVRAALDRLIDANGVKEGRARLTLLGGLPERGAWKAEKRTEGAKARRTDLLIMTGEARASSSEGLVLTVSPYRANSHSPLAGIKSLNYLEHLLAHEEARARDFDEAVRLNERGELVSATMANLFWVTGGKLHTPALSTGALNGTTRACIIKLAQELSIPVLEGVYELSDLGDADEIFLTSAGLGLGVVTTFDFRHYTVPVGSVVLRLYEAFRQLAFQVDERGDESGEA